MFKLTGRGKLSENDVKAMREIKLALLEADVSFAVVKSHARNCHTVSAEVLRA